MNQRGAIVLAGGAPDMNLKIIMLLAGVSLLSGCNLMKGRISSGGSVVQGVKDAGSPATLSTFNAGEALKLAAGSHIVMTKVHATAAIPATKDTPAQPAQPEKEVTEIIPAQDTEWHKTEATVAANTGTVDTTIRAHEIDAAESRPLLYAAIGAALAAGFFVYRAYPTPAICCGAASVVFFLAWRLSGLPPWFSALGLAGIAGGVALWLGHERGLKSATAPEAPATLKTGGLTS